MTNADRRTYDILRCNPLQPLEAMSTLRLVMWEMYGVEVCLDT